MKKENVSKLKANISDSKLRKRISKIKRRLFKHIWVVRTLLVFGIVGVFIALFVGFKGILVKTGVSYYFDLAYNFVFAPESRIKSFNGRTNVLILGKGGAGHEAPELTDTIIFASFERKGNYGLLDLVNGNRDATITLISLPRDIWIPELRAKLNSVYYWGNQKQEGGGFPLASSIIEKIVGKPIDYTVIIDFNGFEKIIDAVGGIEVDVENSFTDNEYPIAGREADTCDGDLYLRCRYETVTFEKGLQHMDGTTALKYVRSRHAEGGEGSDFARSARQQKVISALKDKMLSKDVIKDPKKMLAIWNLLQEYTETDINTQTAAVLARLGYNARANINSETIPEELLYQPELQDRFDNLYVFIPKKEDPEDPSGVSWVDVYDWIDCVLNGNHNCILEKSEQHQNSL